jgi:hypothetical protein
VIAVASLPSTPSAKLVALLEEIRFVLGLSRKVLTWLALQLSCRVVRDFERKDPTFKGIVFSQWTSFLNIIQASLLPTSLIVHSALRLLTLSLCSLSCSMRSVS